MMSLSDTVWRSLLDADLSRRYYEVLAERYRKLDVMTKVFLAAMSSGAAAGWTIWSDSALYPLGVACWRVLSGASAVLAVASPILNYPRKRECSGRLAAEYFEIMQNYELLWLEAEDGKKNEQVRTELKRIGQRETKLAPFGYELPRGIERLRSRCRAEVLRSRGLRGAPS
jgi:hypothetical protein